MRSLLCFGAVVASLAFGVGCQKTVAPPPLNKGHGGDVVDDNKPEPIAKVDEKPVKKDDGPEIEISLVKDPEPTPPKVKVDDPPVFVPKNAPRSPLDRLDPKLAPADDRARYPAETVAILPGRKNGSVRDLAFIDDGKRLALFLADGVLEFWDLTGVQPKLDNRFDMDQTFGKIKRVAFSKDGNWLASIDPATLGRNLRLWKIGPKGELRFVAVETFSRVEEFAFHPSSKRLICGGTSGTLLEVSERGLTRLPQTVPGALNTHTFLRDGDSLAAVVFNQARNGQLYGAEVKLWSLANDQVVETHLLQQNRTIKALAINPDLTKAATSTLEPKLGLWDLTARPPTVRYPFPASESFKRLYFVNDGAQLVAMPMRNALFVWDVQRNKLEKSMTFTGSGNLGVHFSTSALAPDGRHLAVATFEPALVILRLSH